MKKLLHSLNAALGTGVDTYRVIRRQIFWVVWTVLILAIIAIALNFFGLRTVNTIIGCVLPILGIYIASSPTVVGWILGLGAITSPRHPINGIENAMKTLASWLEQILFLLGFFFLVAGTMPLGRNFWGVAIVILCLGLLIAQGRGINRRLAYLYIVSVFALTIASMIPAPVHKKAYGHDLFSWLRVSPVENALARVEDAETEVNEKAITAALAVIEKKIREGQDLTTNDLFIKAYAKAVRDENTAPAKAKEAWKGMFPAKLTSGPTIPALAGKTLMIELQPNQVYDIDDLREGQSWRYLSFNGDFSNRINKGDDQACWKVVDHNLTRSAGWAGKLQVKAGGTPVKLTVNISP